MEKLPEAWIETALRITGHFEDSTDPFGAVTGDFDGMGISLGVLQWNIGSGSLQPLVAKVGRASVVDTMPHYGVELWNACHTAIPNGLSIVRGWHTGAKLRPPVREELKAFTHGAAFVAQQVLAAKEKAATALGAAEAWSESLPNSDAVSLPVFCWFFDVLTQNGGLKGLSYADVAAFIHANGIEHADDAVCDWLAERTSADAGYRDSIKNAELWRNKVDAKALPLFVLSYLRALKSRMEYRADVLNRKATIALGQGWVHLSLQDVRSVLTGEGSADEAA